MLGIATILFALPFVDVAGVGWIVLLLILSLTTLSATQDVAIDSYSVGLVAREEEGVANGVRASAYRLALVMFGGGMVFLAAVLAGFPRSSVSVEPTLCPGGYCLHSAWIVSTRDPATQLTRGSAGALA